MVRTQVYLTESQDERLKRLVVSSGRRQSELIRDALEAYLEANKPQDWKEALRRAYGIWSDRDDLDELYDELRDEVEERLDRRSGAARRE